MEFKSLFMDNILHQRTINRHGSLSLLVGLKNRISQIYEWIIQI